MLSHSESEESSVEKVRGEQLVQGDYMAGVRFEPTTHRLNVKNPTTIPPHPMNVVFLSTSSALLAVSDKILAKALESRTTLTMAFQLSRGRPLTAPQWWD